MRHTGTAVVTDLGRPGLAGYGIPAGGAADQYSAAVANLLVGNAEGDPLIEVTGSDLELATERPALVAVTGAPATITVGGRAAQAWTPVEVPAGEPVAVRGPGRGQAGLRSYVAVNGRWDVPRLIDSCAPAPQLGVGTWLRPGASVTVDSDYRPVDHPFTGHPVFRFGVAQPRFGLPCVVSVTTGPDARSGTAAALDSAVYTVESDSDLVGLRLSGPTPDDPDHPELTSKGVPAGAVELTPSSELVVLLRGRPVTAGYPVVAVATRTALCALGQVGPGHTVRFRHGSVDDAINRARRQRADLDELARRVRTAYDELGIPHRIEG